jgi:ribosomal-protein-alanine N-acetyltransferase
VRIETVEVLLTERLRLRPFVFGDQEKLFEFQMDAETMSTYGGGIPLSQAEAEEVLKYHVECRAYPYWAWAVTLIGEDVCFGQVTAAWVDYKGEKWVELGWILNKEMWGKGYGPEAVRAAVLHGKKELEWTRVMADARATNRRSIRLMEKVGFKFAGSEESNCGRRLCFRFELPGEWDGSNF